MSRIEFGLWANEQAVFGTIFLLASSIVSAAGQFPRWYASVAAAVLALPLCMLEWARPARVKGRVAPRIYQAPFTNLVSRSGRVGASYFVRFIFLLITATAAVFSLPTLLPGVCLIFAALTYLLAAARGEQWRPIEQRQSRNGRQPLKPIIEAPNHPPPRMPRQITTTTQ